MQLRYNNLFNLIENDYNYWKTQEMIPEKVVNFINRIVDNLFIVDIATNNLYCSSCLEKLNNNICPKCHRTFEKVSDKNFLISANINDMDNCTHIVSFYVFDIVYNDVYLYKINNHLQYKKELSYYKTYRINNIIIDQIYKISKDGLFDLKTNDFLSFTNLASDFEKEQNGEITDLFMRFVELTDQSFLYLDNLKLLKNTDLYKYSYLWKIKNNLENIVVSLCSITFNPLYHKEFEYLIKMKLYNLAFSSFMCNIKYKGSFKETFGIDKKYYNFMRNINITERELNVLKLYPTTNKEFLKLMNKYNFYFKELFEYITPAKIMNYLHKQNLNDKNISDYYDYIMSAKKIGLDLSQKSILFPKNFMKAHNEITYQVLINKDKCIDERIANLSKFLEINRYEDDKYVIFPANSINSLIDESNQMNNCVRTYCEKYSNNECQIYFMRYKNSQDKSLVTIEVNDNKIVQAKTKFNKEPSLELKNIINKWEQNLIPVTNY